MTHQILYDYLEQAAALRELCWVKFPQPMILLPDSRKNSFISMIRAIFIRKILKNTK